jgi:hypothetical protein
MFIYFLLNLLRYRSFSNPIKEKYSGTVAVLANGPSLKEIVSRLTTDNKFKNIDFIVMNFFAFDDVFFKIRPKHYCFSDRMFFCDSPRSHKMNKTSDIKKIFHILQYKVDWELAIYIPKSMYRDFLDFSGITNKKISIVGINCVNYDGYDFLRNFFYKKGLAMPIPLSVVIPAIFVCLNIGYSKIKLYGVDHTFFGSLFVNQQNELCNKIEHFYEKEMIIEFEPVIEYWHGGIEKMTQFLKAKTLLFESHDLLFKYCKYLNKEIINCTSCSLIDSYPRELDR